MMWRPCRTHATLKLLLAQCILFFIAPSQSHDDGRLADKQNHEKLSVSRAYQGAARYLVNMAPSQPAGEHNEAAGFPTLPPKSHSASVESTREPPESRDTAKEVSKKSTAEMIATSTTRAMVLDLHDEPAETTKFLQSIVLMNVAMCDTLTCPVGFEHRQPAYRIGCVSQVCSLDEDGQSCCVRKVQWWMHMLMLFAVFCCCSLLCGVGGAYMQSYVDKMKTRQRRTKVRLSRSRSDESEDHTSQDGLLENEKVPKDVQPLVQSAMAAPAAALFSNGSTMLPASSVV